MTGEVVQLERIVRRLVAKARRKEQQRETGVGLIGRIPNFYPSQPGALRSIQFEHRAALPMRSRRRDACRFPNGPEDEHNGYCQKGHWLSAETIAQPRVSIHLAG